VDIANRWDRIRSSLFYVPLLFSGLGALLGQGALLLDARAPGVPDRLASTVDSARSVLSVIASATLTFAGIAFSVSLLLISAASSQYSPRVVRGLFRDPFNKRVMGVVIGTFIYCLVVMRAVRGPLEEAGTPVIPSISVLLAVVLGMTAILSIVAFINHSAHSMEVSTMLHRVTEDALEAVHGNELTGWDEDAEPTLPDEPGQRIVFAQQGWVQGVQHDALLRALPAEATVALHTTAGRYAIIGSTLCTVWCDDGEGVDGDQVRRSVTIGPSRTMQQDTSFGIRQLADVALKALSPGINDPTTAQDALFHMASVVRPLLLQPPGGRVRTGDDGRVLIALEASTPDELVGLAFDEVRLAAVGQPTVLIYLLEILRVLVESVDGTDARDDAIRTALQSQAASVRDLAVAGHLPTYDRGRITDAHASRFPE
jgi:uncharacterized membrane protein